jgi:hypothetical protein
MLQFFQFICFWIPPSAFLIQDSLGIFNIRGLSCCGDMPLKATFLVLFSIAQDKEASVADLMSFRNGVLHWDQHFSRSFQDWELEPLTSFMDVIYSLLSKGYWG